MTPSLPSMPSSIGSLVTSLSSSRSKRTDWTTAKAASLARVNDILRKETDGRRRSPSRCLQNNNSRTRSLTPNNIQQRSYRRSNSSDAGQSYGYINANGQVFNNAQDVMHSRQERCVHGGRSQSADLVAMRNGYHGTWHYRPYINQHPSGHMSHSFMSPRANIHMYQEKCGSGPHPSPFYMSNSRDGYQVNAVQNIAPLMSYGRTSFHPASAGVGDTSSTAALGSLTDNLASGSNVALNGDFHSSDTYVSGYAHENNMPRAQHSPFTQDFSRSCNNNNLVMSSSSTCTSDRLKQKMERIETVKRQAKSRVDSRRASNSSIDLNCYESPSGMSVRTTKTAVSTPKSFTARTVKSAPQMRPRRNSAQGDWLCQVRSRGETNQQGSASDNFRDRDEPIGHVYSSGNKPAATNVSPLRGRDVSPSVVNPPPPPPIKNRKSSDEGTMFSAASSFISSATQTHGEQKEGKAVKSLESKIANSKDKAMAVDKSVTSKSSESKFSMDSTADEASNNATGAASRVSVSSFKDRGKVKLKRHVSFTDETKYMNDRPMSQASSPDEENGSSSIDAPGWRGSNHVEKADPPASLPEDLSSLFNKNKNQGRHASDDSDVTIKSKCYRSNYEEIRIQDASVCSSSLGSLALSKRVSFRDKETSERKERDDSFALEHLWDVDHGMNERSCFDYSNQLMASPALQFT
ncbi:hypothetical protein ACHAWO_009122 [Cyclotella atomus]|uniref:Uncharacterized protein n=1 Tax=Cyclotella atomus TaxID=382360 RepID=A0ABD3PBP3_9STRA